MEEGDEGEERAPSSILMGHRLTAHITRSSNVFNTHILSPIGTLSCSSRLVQVWVLLALPLKSAAPTRPMVHPTPSVSSAIGVIAGVIGAERFEYGSMFHSTTLMPAFPSSMGSRSVRRGDLLEMCAKVPDGRE